MSKDFDDEYNPLDSAENAGEMGRDLAERGLDKAGREAINNFRNNSGQNGNFDSGNPQQPQSQNAQGGQQSQAQSQQKNQQAQNQSGGQGSGQTGNAPGQASGQSAGQSMASKGSSEAAKTGSGTSSGAGAATKAGADTGASAGANATVAGTDAAIKGGTAATTTTATTTANTAGGISTGGILWLIELGIILIIFFFFCITMLCIVTPGLIESHRETQAHKTDSELRGIDKKDTDNVKTYLAEDFEEEDMSPNDYQSPNYEAYYLLIEGKEIESESIDG